MVEKYLHKLFLRCLVVDSGPDCRDHPVPLVILREHPYGLCAQLLPPDVLPNAGLDYHLDGVGRCVHSTVDQLLAPAVQIVGIAIDVVVQTLEIAHTMNLLEVVPDQTLHVVT